MSICREVAPSGVRGLPMNRRRIVITGLGVVAPNALGKDQFEAALLSGVSGIRKASGAADFEPSCQVEARVADFNLPELALRTRHAGKSRSRVSQFALACA